MKTILLVRHGQASFGSDNYDKLSELGIKQAQLLGEYFHTQGKQIDHVFAGTLVRQQDSAKHFLDNFYNDSEPYNVTSLENFNEFNHQQILLKATELNNLGELKQQLSHEENPKRMLAELFKRAMIRWHAAEQLHNELGDYDEGWLDFASRCFEGLTQVIEHTGDNETSMVFTSGGVIASIASTLYDLSSLEIQSQTAFAINRQLVNTGVSRIRIASQTGKSQLLTLNACEHLTNRDETHKKLITWY